MRLNALAGLGFCIHIEYGQGARHAACRQCASRFVVKAAQTPQSWCKIQTIMLSSRISACPMRELPLIPGSGVDTDILTPMQEPAGTFTVGFVGRLLDDKGAQTLVGAHELLTQRGVVINTLMAGEPDPSNPASIPDRVLDSWRLIPNICLLGHVEDIRSVWGRAHIAILPSRREGLPKSLLEAAACGRPLIATDVPGCREIARGGVNAILVPTDDAEALAQAIETLSKDRELRVRLGRASREIVTTEYSSTLIGSEIAALYSSLLDAALPSKLQVGTT